MQDVVGMGLSLVYVLAVLAASSLLARHGMGEEGTRKLVHVALGGWWVVAALFFTSPWWAAALPAAFIVVNALAWRKQKLAFMARGEGEDTPGTVYYAVSLTLIALFSFGLGAPYVGALGVFCMAFGDGLAAVLGRRFGRRPLPGVQACCWRPPQWTGRARCRRSRRARALRRALRRRPCSPRWGWPLRPRCWRPHRPRAWTT